MQEQENPSREPHRHGSQEDSRFTTLIVAPLMGTVSGSLSYLIARAISSEQNAELIATRVGASTILLGLGASLSTHSMSEAEDYLETSQKGKSRLKVTQAILEGAVGFGTTGGLLAFDGSVTKTVMWAGVSAICGGLATYFTYRDRIRPYPKLAFPVDNSVFEDTSFPNRIGGHKFPPVFSAASIEDWKEFREANKEVILEWAREVPPKSDTPNKLNAKRLLTSVVIIPDVSHYPVLDPKDNEIMSGALKKVNQDMKLSDKNDSLIAQPCNHTFMMWPYQTCFESIIGESRYFEDSQWDYWREKSWKHDVVLLAQYQHKNPSLNRLILNDYKTEEVEDYYWLLDIYTNERGEKKKVEKKLPKIKTIPVLDSSII